MTEEHRGGYQIQLSIGDLETWKASWGWILVHLRADYVSFWSLICKEE